MPVVVQTGEISAAVTWGVPPASDAASS